MPFTALFAALSLPFHSFSLPASRMVAASFLLRFHCLPSPRQFLTLRSFAGRRLRDDVGGAVLCDGARCRAHGAGDSAGPGADGAEELPGRGLVRCFMNEVEYTAVDILQDGAKSRSRVGGLGVGSCLSSGLVRCRGEGAWRAGAVAVAVAVAVVVVVVMTVVAASTHMRERSATLPAAPPLSVVPAKSRALRGRKSCSYYFLNNVYKGYIILENELSLTGAVPVYYPGTLCSTKTISP